MQTLKLESGLKIGNFSSPHPFIFDTGEVLPACTPEWCTKNSMEKISKEVNHETLPIKVSKVSFNISDEVLKRLTLATKDVQVMIVPFPMLTALQEYYDSFYRKGQPTPEWVWDCYTCFLTDRVNKTVSSTVFCQ